VLKEAGRNVACHSAEVYLRKRIDRNLIAIITIVICLARLRAYINGHNV